MCRELSLTRASAKLLQPKKLKPHKEAHIINPHLAHLCGCLTFKGSIFQVLLAFLQNELQRHALTWHCHGILEF